MLIYYSTDAQHTGAGPVSSGVQLTRSYEYWRNGKESFTWGPDKIWSVPCSPLQSPAVREESSTTAASRWALSHALLADHL